MAEAMSAAVSEGQQQCRICLAEGVFPVLRVPERMFASFEPFDYFRCLGCGCLQIATIPQDLSRYYPQDYYSYQSGPASGWRSLLRRWRNRGLMRGGPAALLNLLQPFEALKAVAGLHPKSNWRILDVGCGQGQLVLALRELGYAEALGIDPFLEQDLSPFILRQSLAETAPCWDLIMLHHSLEHLPDPRAAFAELARLLSPGGMLLIRVPTCDSWAFEHYGEHWVQWDPPRHLYLFSRSNLALLARSTGLRVLSHWDDSGPLQFSGSERYLLGLPLAGLGRPSPVQALRAVLLNARRRGDQISALIGR